MLTVIRNAADLGKVSEIFSSADVLAIDTETSPAQVPLKEGVEALDPEHPEDCVDQEQAKVCGLDPYRNRLRLLQLSDGNNTVVIMADFVPPRDLEVLQPLLDRVVCVGVNLGFDWKQLVHHCNLEMQAMWDLGLAEALLTAGQVEGSDWFHLRSLKSLMKQYLDIDVDKEIRAEFAYGLPITQEQLDYSVGDVEPLIKVHQLQREKVTQHRLIEAAELEMGAIAAFSEMELTGMFIDTDAWLVLARRAEQRSREIYDELQLKLLPQKYKDMFGDAAKYCRVVDPGSSTDLPKALARVGIVVPNTKEQTLQDYLNTHDDEFQRDVINTILDWRNYRKQATTYGEPFLINYVNPVTHRVHTQFSQIGAETLRTSSARPNLQNIPGKGEEGTEYRKCFRTPPDSNLSYVFSDLSGAELRILAWFSQDPAMMEAFNSDPEKDLHSATAAAMFGYDYEAFLKLIADKEVNAVTKRKISKNINFGTCYGAGAGKISSQSNIPLEEAKKFLSIWKTKVYPAASRYLDTVAQRARRDLEVRGYAGYRRYFIKPNPNDLTDEEYRWAYGRIERQAKNFKMQNGNKAMMVKAVALVHPRLKPFGAKLCNMVHDELGAVCHEMVADDVAEILQTTMIEAANFFMRKTENRQAVRGSSEVNIATHWSH